MNKKDYNQFQNPSAFIDQDQLDSKSIPETQPDPVQNQPWTILRSGFR